MEQRFKGGDFFGRYFFVIREDRGGFCTFISIILFLVCFIYLQRVFKGEFVDDMGYVWVLWLGCGVVCGYMEVVRDLGEM